MMMVVAETAQAATTRFFSLPW